MIVQWTTINYPWVGKNDADCVANVLECIVLLKHTTHNNTKMKHHQPPPPDNFALYRWPNIRHHAHKSLRRHSIWVLSMLAVPGLLLLSVVLSFVSMNVKRIENWEICRCMVFGSRSLEMKYNNQPTVGGNLKRAVE